MEELEKISNEAGVDDGSNGGLKGVDRSLLNNPNKLTPFTVDQFKQQSRMSAAMSNMTPGVADIRAYGKDDSEFGKSTYDKNSENISDLNDLEDTRGFYQPLSHKIGLGLGTLATKTVTNAVGGLGALFYSAPLAALNGDLSKMYDNALMKTIDSVNEEIDNGLKIYSRTQEREGSFSEQTVGSAHF